MVVARIAEYMRLGIISDVHGNLVALEHVLADLKTRAPDLVVNLGDCVSAPLWPRETYELLETLRLPTVRGNHDRWLTELPDAWMTPSARFASAALTSEQRQALGALPASIAVAEGILAVHGTPTIDTEYLLEENVVGRLALVTAQKLDERLANVVAGLVLCGHSHHQHATMAFGGRMVVNPGSVGCPRYADNADPSVAEAGSPHARYAIATRRGKRWSVELIALEYDWSVVAQHARRNGRKDWATGYLRER
jgi:putative phosphoesterase